jgi:hypothetical protein
MPVYSHIPFDKKLTLTAFNRLENVTIRSVHFDKSDAQTIRVDLIIDILNPSLFTIDLGRRT